MLILCCDAVLLQASPLHCPLFHFRLAGHMFSLPRALLIDIGEYIQYPPLLRALIFTCDVFAAQKMRLKLNIMKAIRL
jgi:hypothetical protein